MANNHNKGKVQHGRHSQLSIAGAGYFSGTANTGSILATSTYLNFNGVSSSVGPLVAQVGYVFLGSPDQAGPAPILSSSVTGFTTGTYGAANTPGTYVIQFADSYSGLISADVQIHGRKDMFATISCSLSYSVSNSTGSWGVTLMSGTVTKPNSAIVFNTYFTGSNTPAQVPSGSTPCVMTFEALFQNSSQQH